MLLLAALFLLGAGACASDLTCPGGRVEREGVCACPDASVEREGRCTSGAGTDPAGVRADGGAARPRDDAGVAAPPSPGSPPVAAEDGGAPVAPPASPGAGPAGDAAVAAPPVSPPPAAMPPAPSPPASTSAPAPAPAASDHCGNLVIEPQYGEECEIGLVGGWDASNCDASCQRRPYKLCDFASDQLCPVDSQCYRGVCSRVVEESCFTEVAAQLGTTMHPCARQCPQVPGNPALIDLNTCVLRCPFPNSPNACPRGLKCGRLDLDPALPPEQEPTVCVGEGYPL